MNTSQRILKDSTIVTILNIGSRGIGFLVPILLAALFGASSQADAYYLANTIPTFVVQIVVIALSTVFVPIFVEQIVNTPERLDETVSSTAILLILFSLVAMLILAGTIPLLLPRFTGEMNTSTLKLTIQLTLALMPILLLSTLVGLASAVLNSYRKFFGPVLAPGIRGFVVLVISLFGYQVWGIYAVIWGLLIGELVALLALMYLTHSCGVRFRPVIKIHPAVKRAFRFSLPMIIGMVVIRFNPIIDRFMAAPLGEGSISILNFADKIITIPITLLTAGFFVVLLTQWSEVVAQGDLSKLQSQLEKAIIVVVFIILPISVYLVLMQNQIVSILFERGAFNEEDVVSTAQLLGIFALGLIPFMIILVLNRIYLAMQDTKVPMFIGFANATFNLVFNIALISFLGLAGIALSTTITYYLLCLMSLIILGKRFQIHLSRDLIFQLLKIFMAALVFLIVIECLQSLGSEINNLLLVFITSFAGMFIYVGAAYVFHLSLVRMLMMWLRTKTTRLIRVNL